MDADEIASHHPGDVPWRDAPADRTLPATEEPAPGEVVDLDGEEQTDLAGRRIQTRSRSTNATRSHSVSPKSNSTPLRVRHPRGKRVHSSRRRLGATTSWKRKPTPGTTMGLKKPAAEEAAIHVVKIV